MNVLDRLTAALGPPQFLREIGDDGGRPVAAVGRWRHGGARVLLGGVGTTQVILNLSGGQQVELRTHGRCLRRTVRAGSVAVVPAGDSTDVRVAGEADTVQIVVTRELIHQASLEPPLAVPPGPGALEPLLQAAAAQMFVAASAPGREGAGASLDAGVRTIARLLARLPAARSEPARGGLAPGARRRVRALIDGRLSAEPCSPPALGELARAAGLSVHHFVRAFRATEGQTPCARVTRLRIDASLALLFRDGGARVDEVADAMGFCSPAHFVGTFRRHLGVTPGALRDAARRQK